MLPAHAGRTRVAAVALDALRGLPAVDLEILRAAFLSGQLQVWGATIHQNCSDVKKYAQLQAGSLVSIAKDEMIFSAGRMAYTFRSDEIAEKLWKRSGYG